jgi:dihydrofolate synthase/folylpolyglutamate synthase
MSQRGIPLLQRKEMDRPSLAQWLARLETLHPNAMDLGLERVSAVARALDLLPVPQPVVTVAGTNGKGSTVAVLEAILGEAGQRVGAFTSPHLLRFNERVRVGGLEVADEELIDAFAAIDVARGDITLTYFEFAALAALLVFRSREVQVLVLEVGLGGRLDAVNMVDPTVAVITSIDLDHQEWLGDTRGAIAIEKAGILRPGVPLVLADLRPPPELYQCASELGAEPLLDLGRDWQMEKTGDQWQASLRKRSGEIRRLPPQACGPLLPINICAGLQAALLLDVEFDDRQLQRAMAAARPRGRRECTQRGGVNYVLDVAHNPAAVNSLVEYIDATPCKGKIFALFSVMADKDITAMIGAAAGCFDGWFVADQPATKRSAAGSRLAAALGAAGEQVLDLATDPAAAFAAAQRQLVAGDCLVVFGSFFTVGDVLPLLAEQSLAAGACA